MMIKHVMKDGTIVEDITGHTVKRSDAESVYNLLESINRKNVNKGKRNGVSEKQRRV